MLIVYKNNSTYEKNDIWLPRQDQLQEIVCTTLFPRTWQDIYLDFFDLWFNRPSNGFEHSFEKMWLKYLMRELYNKKWNNEKLIWQLR